MSNFKLPTYKQRLAVMGKTGSGKTQFANWILSHSPFDKQPYIIVDYKGDDLIAQIDRAREIGLNESLPKQPGIYVVRPRPSDEEEVEDWLWKVWDREKIGLYFDEAYMVPDKGALRSILTQGRSKRIPAIILTQRPAFISRFVFSEADLFAVFHLNDEIDHKKIRGFTPQNSFWDLKNRLPDYFSRWYDVGQDVSLRLSPVPPGEEILARFERRLEPKKRWL